MKRIAFVTALSVLFAVQTASAMDRQTIDFRGSSLPAGVGAHGLTGVLPSADGLYIKTDTDGYLMLPKPTNPADSLVIVLTNVDSTASAVLWSIPGLPPDSYYQHNVDLPTGPVQELPIPMHLVDEWSRTPSVVGLAFPASSELLIHAIEWRGYSWVEKLANGFMSFWTPDKFRLYSINFLWGPLIGPTPEARATLYDALPPRSWSATRIFYGIFVVAAIVVLLVTPKHLPWQKALRILAIVGAVLWIVFDLRMTQEMFRYVADDWRTYVLARGDDRSLRSHASLYDALERAKELIGDDEKYVIVSYDNTPFYANVRYALYPAVPVKTTEPHDDVAAWIVLAMPEVGVRNGMIVADDGRILSRTGSIVERFDDSSFFFRVTQ